MQERGLTCTAEPPHAIWVTSALPMCGSFLPSRPAQRRGWASGPQPHHWLLGAAWPPGCIAGSGMSPSCQSWESGLAMSGCVRLVADRSWLRSG